MSKLDFYGIIPVFTGTLVRRVLGANIVFLSQ